MAAIPIYKLKDLEHVRRLPKVEWVHDADLPPIFTIEESPGAYYINIAKWFDWNTGILRAEIVPGAGDVPESVILSIPGLDGKQVKNIFVTADGKLQIDFEDS